MNVEALIRTYFEADRAAVRARYEDAFPAMPQASFRFGAEIAAGTKKKGPLEKLTGPELTKARKQDVAEKKWVPSAGLSFFGDPGDAAAVRDLIEDLLYALGMTVDAQDAVIDAISRSDWIDQAALLHHLRLLAELKVTPYCGDGLLALLGPWTASRILHNISPNFFFPLNNELPHPRYENILRAFGINPETSLDESVLENAWSISDAILDFTKQHKLEPWQTWALIHDLGPRLLPSDPPFPIDPAPRIWISAAGPDDFEAVDSHASTARAVWSANEKAQYGDLILMYCKAPRSSIVAIYRCMTDAYTDPLDRSWTGVWAEIGEKLVIPPLTFQEMRSDPMLSEWAMIKMQFQGLMKHAVPNDVWLRLVELVERKDAEAASRIRAYAGSAQGVRHLISAPGEVSEQVFEDSTLIPLLARLGWRLGNNLERQVEMSMKVGSGRPVLARADLVGYKGALGSAVEIVVESKRSIRTTVELEQAMLQAESYAGKLRCTRFAVAAPQGIWAFELSFPSQSRALNDQPIPLEEGSIGRLQELLGSRESKA